MTYSIRSFVVLSSGALKHIGVQTLQEVLNGRQPCKLTVEGELRVIQVMCLKKSTPATAVQRAWFFKHKLLPTRYIDEADYNRSLRVAMDQMDLSRRPDVAANEQVKARLADLDKAAQEWTWTPTPEQLKECRIKLGLPV